ncbi:hypothetical protein [Flavobacterium sp. CAU 1735]|uniref:protein kinase domain-containing protein n=1 Tax=Flavobacterium sp. CAU 1735 TaxID=3140361 RepID=UPI003261C546
MEKIKDYTVIKTIQENGENANVYLVEKEGKKFVAKHFTKSVKPYVQYGKKNHFGRRREGADEVFKEIKSVSEKHSFIIQFYEKFKWDKKWCIIIDYFEGNTMNEFLFLFKDDKIKILTIIEKFALEVKLWHKNQFALGDAHLDNILVNSLTEEIRLIDYSQMHHPDFKYCKKFNCFNPQNRRIDEDLENTTKHFGRGFITELRKAQTSLKIEIDLAQIFQNKYQNCL